MNNIQSISIISAFPIGIIMILILISFFKDAGKYLAESSKSHDSTTKMQEVVGRDLLFVENGKELENLI